MTRTFRRTLLLLLALGVAGAGCAGGDDSATDSGGETASEAPAVDRAEDTDRMPLSDATGIGRDLIIEMSVSIESPSIDRSVSLIEAAVRSEQGLVTSSQVASGGEGDDGWATIVARVPPDALDSFIERLDRPDEIGRITSTSRWSEDVTDQLVELDVRIENQRESVTAIRRLMSQATDLTDLVLLEGELTRRQTDLEILLARQADLTGRVEMATVTIDLHSAGTTPTDDRGVLDGFADGWNAFLTVVVGLGWFLAAVSPFVGAAALIGALIAVAARSRRR